MKQNSSLVPAAMARLCRVGVLGLSGLLAACRTTEFTPRNENPPAHSSTTRDAAAPDPTAVAPDESPTVVAVAHRDREGSDLAQLVRVAGDSWTPLQAIWFMYNRANLEASEREKVAEIVRYLELNPSVEVGIDSSLDSLRAETDHRAMNSLRIATIRTALLEAGISASRIQVGDFGDQRLAYDRRIAVLVRGGR